jgi:predicted nucleotidyltransferase
MTFSPDQLAVTLQRRCPQAIFALVHGSAKDGFIRPEGDVDVALLISGKPTLELYEAASRAIEEAAPGAKPDIGILNSAEPIYRFEALSGRLLFCRDEETYLRFFSLTCREYESQMASYQRQQRYRRDAASAA